MIYIDDEFKCHTTNPDGTYREIKTNIFSGIPTAFVECFRYIPVGESWTREDGEVFNGEMATPWIDLTEMDAKERKHEREQLADAENALAILLGGAV